MIEDYENDTSTGRTVFTLKSPSLPAEEWDLLPNSNSGFAITHLSSNFFMVENEQVDFVTVYNDAATADQTGNLTADRLTGLAMTEGEGIAYADFETLEIFLGSGADTFTVDGTMKKRTASGL